MACPDCKGTGIYKGLGVSLPEPCRTCCGQMVAAATTSKRPPVLDDAGLMNLIQTAMKTGAHLDTLLQGRKLQGYVRVPWPGPIATH